MNTVKKIHLRKIQRPLKTTFSTSLGKKDFINSIIVTVHLSGGSSGSGECPTSFTMKHETIEAIEKIVLHSSTLLKNTAIEKYPHTIKQMRKLYPWNPMTIAGIESALFHAHLASTGVDEHAYFGQKSRTIETDITIPFTTEYRKMETWLRYARMNSFRIYKLKVSGNIHDDRTLITKICDHLTSSGTDFTIRLDGNQGYSVKSALTLIDFVRSREYPVELFEQPIRKDDYGGLREVSGRSSLPIILDETVINTNDLNRVIGENLGHGINIKIAKSGIAESLKLYDMAKKHNQKLMIGCMTETMVGLSTGICLAAGKGDFDYIDLDAIHFLRHAHTYGQITIVKNTYHIERSDISQC